MRRPDRYELEFTILLFLIVPPILWVLATTVFGLFD